MAIWIEGNLNINGRKYPFVVDNEIDTGFDHDGYSSQAYNIINGLNGFLNKLEEE